MLANSAGRIEIKSRNRFEMNEMTFDTTAPETSNKTITEALIGVWQNPSLLIRQWNYKGAILSGALRAPIFLITYLVGRESLKLAIGAATAQFVFRFAFAGVGGALIQAFRRVEPAWKALAAILLIVPVISHIFEFLVQVGFAHFTQTADHTGDAVIRSICISILSALFSLFIMRRNVMIVGEAESKSIWSDIAQLPFLVFDFVMFVPFEIIRMFRRADYLRASLIVLTVGLFSQFLGWAITGKLFWTYNKGKTTVASWWGVDGLIMLVLSLILALFILRYKAKNSEETEVL